MRLGAISKRIIPGAAELLHGPDNFAQLVVEVVGEDEVDGFDLAEVLAVGQRVRVWKIRQVHGGGRLQEKGEEESMNGRDSARCVVLRPLGRKSAVQSTAGFSSRPTSKEGRSARAFS